MPKRNAAQRLERLFTRRRDGWGPRSAVGSSGMVARMIEAGRLTVRMHRLPMAASLAAARMQGGARSESIDHIRMKRAAREWMRAEGASDAHEEVRSYNGKFDVYSADADWIVECGNSSMDKLIDAIREEDCPRFTLIPYQDTERHDDSPRRLIAVDFLWDEGLGEELNDLIMSRDAEAMLAHDRENRARKITEAQARKAARVA
jgi:hypothetical protein